MTRILILMIVKHLMPVISVDISLDDICGNKLVGTCPDKINVKVIIRIYHDQMIIISSMPL